MPSHDTVGGPRARPATCGGCGLVCDDITAVVGDDGGLERLIGACPLGDAWFTERLAPAPPLARVDGREAGLDEAKTEAVRLRTISVVAELLKGGYACVGDPDGRDGFAPWALTEEQALTRIEREWDALGREPDIAEIAWFGLTEKGEEYLAEPRLTNEHALDDRSS